MKKYIGQIFLLAIVIHFIGCNTNEKKHQKIGFIQNVKVFEEFNMKKDYDKKIEEDLKIEVGILDSLQLLINKLSIQGNDLEISTVKQEYFSKQEQYNKLFQNLSTTYTNEVNDRLNEYIKEYSIKHDYDILLGSGGEGNVMYTKDGINITDELITFINKKYLN